MKPHGCFIVNTQNHRQVVSIAWTCTNQWFISETSSPLKIILFLKINTYNFGYEVIQMKRRKNSIVKGLGRKHNELRRRKACELKTVQGKRCPIVWIWVTRLTALFGLQKDLVHRIKGAHLWFSKKNCRYACFLREREQFHKTQ